MKQNNPFVLAGYEGPEYFCDRVAETRSLIRAIENGGNVTLLSPRRYGKTGLISNVFHRLAKKGDYETIYIDLFGTQNLSDFTNALAGAVLGKPSLSFDMAARNPQGTLAQIFDYIKERARKVVIALDEFQQVGEYPEKGIDATLRGFVQFSPARFIFAGSKQHIMREMFTSPKRPFYQSTSMMPLDVIPEDAYYKFAEGFFSAKGRHIDRNVFHELYKRFDGITWYLQAMLWEFYADDANIDSIEQLDAAIARRVKSCEYDQQRVLSILPQGSRRLLRAIAKERMVKEPQAGSFIAKHGLRAASSVKTSLDRLVEKELVYPATDGYVVYDRLMAEYLRSIAT